MEIVETFLEWLDSLGQLIGIGAGIFLIVVGFLMKKWSRVGFIMAGVIMLLPFLSWALQETLLCTFFQKAKIVGQVVAVIVAIIAIVVGRWESGVYKVLLFTVGILILMPLTNFLFRLISILFLLAVH